LRMETFLGECLDKPLDEKGIRSLLTLRSDSEAVLNS
jgi:hypothetical protein